ncbi:MAG: NUDIX hydrolase [Pseudomonadota bacterium]
MTGLYAQLAEMNMPFQGAKLAVLAGNRLPVILRDDRPDIAYPDFWDLPGGGREGDEGPLDCALRETVEELSLEIPPASVVWGHPFREGARRQWFFAARVPDSTLASVRLGNEGQCFEIMQTAAFLTHPKAIPHLRDRLKVFLSSDEFYEKPPADRSGGR